MGGSPRVLFSHFHLVSSSSALDVVPVMCIIARPVSECDCSCHFADKKTGSERLSRFPQSRNYLAIGPGFRCKPGKFQRQCSPQAGPRELLDGPGSSSPGSTAYGWEAAGVESGSWGPLLGLVSAFTPFAELTQVSMVGLFWLRGVVLWVPRKCPFWAEWFGSPDRGPVPWSAPHVPRPARHKGGTGMLVMLTHLPGIEPAQGQSSP